MGDFDFMDHGDHRRNAFLWMGVSVSVSRIFTRLSRESGFLESGFRGDAR